MATEHLYTISLRDANRAPRGKRAQKAVRSIRDFLKRHTKRETIRMDPALNERIWERGGKNLKPRIRVKITEEEDDAVKAAPAE
jgi:large subunit ribosomal protein L31e